MGRIRGHHEWDDDDLTPGQKREGGLHQNLFDEQGKLKGSARFIPDSDDTTEPVVVTETVYIPIAERREAEVVDYLAAAATLLVLHGINRGVSHAKPYVTEWWRESARPVLNAQRVKLAARVQRRRARQVGSEAERAASDSGQHRDELSAGRQADMSRAEAQARYLAAMAAHAYSEEQMRLINSSRVIDGTTVENLGQSFSELSSEQIKQVIEAMANSPELLSEARLAELASVLGRRAIR